MATRAVLFAGALVAGALVALVLVEREEAPAPTSTPPPKVLEPEPVVTASEVDAGDEAPPLGPIDFADGFCSKSGSERFELRYTVERLLNEFLARPPPGSEAQVAALQAGLHDPDRLTAARGLAARWPRIASPRPEASQRAGQTRSPPRRSSPGSRAETSGSRR